MRRALPDEDVEVGVTEDASSEGTKRKRAPRTKGPCEHGGSPGRSARCAALVRTGRGADTARSAVGLESASTVVYAITCKECGGSQASCEHVQGVRWGVNLRARSSARLLQGVRWVSNLRARSSAPYVQGVRRGLNLRARCKRSECKECGGGSFCEHSRVRYTCKECSQICAHGRQRSTCKEWWVSNL